MHLSSHRLSGVRSTTTLFSLALRFLPTAGLLALFSGCTVEPSTTYYEPAPAAPAPVVYEEPPPSDGDVVITADSDFYEPLDQYGEWIDVEGYGRCWRPRNVGSDWRPYSEGRWQHTDSGWYWHSDESFGWATYHYGRWTEDSRHGWCWVPDTHWAPAWVSWREGGGYAGWAPLPPRRRNGVNVSVSVDISPRSFVYVNEKHFGDRVRPSNVIVNNTTVINQTTNITNTHVTNNVTNNVTNVTNNTVINQGPRAENIERATGRKLEVTPVRDVRRVEEKKVVIKTRPAVAQPRPRPVAAAPAPVPAARAPQAPYAAQPPAPQQPAHVTPAPAPAPAQVTYPTQTTGRGAEVQIPPAQPHPNATPANPADRKPAVAPAQVPPPKPKPKPKKPVPAPEQPADQKDKDQSKSQQ